jgi:hypothetical protein
LSSSNTDDAWHFEILKFNVHLLLH